MNTQTRLPPLDLMHKLVGFATPSQEPNLPLIEWVADYLRSHGITPHIWPDPDQPGKAALFAHVGPWKEGAVVLSGHTDVVPVDGQNWRSDPWTVTGRNGRYYGRGTCDMKGFDALAIWALVEAQYAGLARPLQLALSFDEEIGCTGAPPMITAMQEALPRGTAVIVGEPSMMRVVTGHKGGQGFPTHVQGFEVHSSIAYKGVSAIHEAARLISWANAQNAQRAASVPDTMASLFDPPYSSWHVGMISGGTAHNITARDCCFSMDFRAVPSDDPTALRQAYLDQVNALRTQMQAVNPQTDITVSEKYTVPPLRPEIDGPAEALARQITGDNGTHVVSYGTEAGQFQHAGYSAVVCGPGDIAQAHQPDEYISIAQFEAGGAFMRALLRRMS